MGSENVFHSKEINCSYQVGVGERKGKRSKPEVSELLPGKGRLHDAHESDCRIYPTFVR